MKPWCLCKKGELDIQLKVCFVDSFSNWICSKRGIRKRLFIHSIWISLTHWDWVTHMCVSELTIIGSDNGLSPGRSQAIIWTNDPILLIGPLGTNYREILIKIHEFSFKKIHLKMSSGKWWPLCFGLILLTHSSLEKLPLAVDCTSINHDSQQRIVVNWYDLFNWYLEETINREKRTSFGFYFHQTSFMQHV